MFGSNMSSGSGMPHDDAAMKMQAVKDMLDKIRGVIGGSEVDKDGGSDDYLDPDKLGQDASSKAGDVTSLLAKAAKPDGMGSEDDMGDSDEESESPDEDMTGGDEPTDPMSAMGGGASDKLDPEELMNFFNKKAGSDRKPLKGMKIGMSEISMSPLQKGMMKKRM